MKTRPGRKVPFLWGTGTSVIGSIRSPENKQGFWGENSHLSLRITTRLVIEHKWKNGEISVKSKSSGRMTGLWNTGQKLVLNGSYQGYTWPHTDFFFIYKRFRLIGTHTSPMKAFLLSSKKSLWICDKMSDITGLMVVYLFI